MVNLELEKRNILKKHQTEYGGGNRIYMGSTDKVPKRVTAQTILDNPDVLKKSKNPFPFKGEILDAPDMPEIVRELTDISQKKEKKTKELTEKKLDEPKYQKSFLETLSFGKLKKIAKKVGETGRSRIGLIKDILKHN